MKRLAAVAVMLVWLTTGAFAQRGGSRGGFSGSHAGFSAPSGGFSSHSAFQSGFSAPRGGFYRPAPPSYNGLARFAYPARGLRPATFGPRTPYGTSMHRTPYTSTYGGNHYHHGYHYPYNHVVYVSTAWPWGWGYPYAWGYPYIWPSIFNDSESYNAPPASYYPAPQPSDYGVGPYLAQPEDQQAPLPETYPQQQPNTFRAPYSGAQATPPAPEAPVTLIFKDGRPPEQVHNYMLTARTLTVFDQPGRNIPLDQLDLNATSRVNLQAGVDFSVPGNPARN